MCVDINLADPVVELNLNILAQVVFELLKTGGKMCRITRTDARLLME